MDTRELIFKDRLLFGIYDIEKNEWTLDCFDSPRLFFSKKAAEEYRTKCIDYNSIHFEVRNWPL